MRAFLAALILCLGTGPVLAERDRIAWSDLIDSDAQSYEDPFLDLSYEQLSALRTKVRLEERLEASTVSDDERAAIAAQIGEANTLLKNEGIDADWLVSQRWIVTERRERAASAGNPALDGVQVSLAGFAIAAPPDADGTPMAYLVPQRGMCSHVPPPPANQLVRLRLSDDWSPRILHEPVVITGQLRIEPDKRRLMVVDGIQTLEATFAMDVVAVESFLTEKAAGPSSSRVSGWSEELIRRLEARQAATADQY
ncbi:DUF3299 domain-containing protein [Tropicibacter sp. R16_0]|uniref:DUF3299 domain-containing protein n=1 Tax=Tropicibacter sp. R16_0 TaxID=2821102 RepID=UPI001ADAFCE1|nr:DUF3299 domain-containing protein [Tropicibacter sp. R16_0]MBO9453038.1 DUF3299 domain-containing protein [Tropicibacter sp. R16_0]